MTPFRTLISPQLTSSTASARPAKPRSTRASARRVVGHADKVLYRLGKPDKPFERALLCTFRIRPGSAVIPAEQLVRHKRRHAVEQHTRIPRAGERESRDIVPALNGLKAPARAVLDMLFDARAVLAVRRLHRRPIDHRSADRRSARRKRFYESDGKTRRSQGP